jgi:hypothetical protein
MAERKRSWFRRHWFLTLILVIVVIAIIAAIANTGKNENSTTGSTDYPCPDLSAMKLNDYDSLVQSWSAQVSPYKSGNLEVVYSDLRAGNIIYCDAGSEEGQNANWVYCGDFIRPIVAQYTDAQGSIAKKRSIEVTFDKDTK